MVELHELLAETLSVPGAREWLLERKITVDEVGLGLVDDTRAFLRHARRRHPHRVLDRGPVHP